MGPFRNDPPLPLSPTCPYSVSISHQNRNFPYCILLLKKRKKERKKTDRENKIKQTKRKKKNLYERKIYRKERKKKEIF